MSYILLMIFDCYIGLRRSAKEVAQKDHLRAQKDHLRAQKDHLRAQKDHLRAQKDHLRAY